MTIKIEVLRNKQRIVITGNHGLEKISLLVRHVLDSAGKSYSFISESDEIIDDSAIVILKGGHQFEDGKAVFHSYKPHIALIHKVSSKIPDGYDSFEQFLSEIEKLADNLPKAGSIIYNETDDITAIIGKKDREDVKPIEYTSLEGKPTDNGFQLSSPLGPVDVQTDNTNFLSHAAAARALTKRIGISDNQFYTALKAL